MRKRLLVKRAALFIALAFALLIHLITHATAAEWPLVSVATSASEAVFRVEIARTQEEISRGLMFRKSLPEDRGMLFVFPNERRLSFWMKNTAIPLDIIFADSEGEIVGIAAMEPCMEEPCPAYSSPDSSMYALEINGGLAKAYNIRPGDRVVFHFELPRDHPGAEAGEP